MPRKTNISALYETESLLYSNGCFKFPSMRTGIYSATPQKSSAPNDATGYSNAWLRDNSIIANSLWRLGRFDDALSNFYGLSRFLATQEEKILSIIRDPTIGADPQKRPHVRFDGHYLRELEKDWSHAQNDALGYFIWFGSRLLRSLGAVNPVHLRLIGMLAAMLGAIRYWQDEDSGHWEEIRKRSASSIGAVVAGLREASALAKQHSGSLPSGPAGARITVNELEQLAENGERSLATILPAECIQEPPKARRYDAALIFLAEPLGVLDSETTLTILSDVRDHLEGEVGIRRYPMDSYWCPGYRRLFGVGVRTSDFSNNLELRDRHAVRGKEAQWCIFDSVLSTLHSRLFRETGDKEHAELQTHYLHRALLQVTRPGMPWPAYRCPEAYFWEEKETHLVPNDHVPLLWAQANLAVALQEARRSFK